MWIIIMAIWAASLGGFLLGAWWAGRPRDLAIDDRCVSEMIGMMESWPPEIPSLLVLAMSSSRMRTKP
jgi:hypothetical protein